MDPLVAHDIELSQRTPPAEKLAQGLQLMELGLRLKRDSLRRAHPEASEAEIQRAFDAWLIADD
jgi:hypothetical protein